MSKPVRVSSMRAACAITISCLLFVLASCGQSVSTENKEAVTDSSSDSSTAFPQMPGHVLSSSQVDRLNKEVSDAAKSVQGKDFRASADARPSYRIDEQGARQVMTIRDEDDVHWDSGSYNLSVYCLGKGNLDILFSVGDGSQSTSMTCTDDIAVSSVRVDTTGADNGIVQIAPSADAACEIGYLITRGVAAF